MVARIIPRMKRTWKVVVMFDEVVATIRSKISGQLTLNGTVTKEVRRLTSRNNTRQHKRRNHAKQTLRPATACLSSPLPTPTHSTNPLPLPSPPLPLHRFLPRKHLHARFAHIRMIHRLGSDSRRQKLRQPSQWRQVCRRREEAAWSFFIRGMEGCGG